MGELFDQLEEYAQSGAYPFHMPGHKRNAEGAGAFFAEWYKLDVTEIPGMDDLHAPEGILKEAEERAAAPYGADRSFFLVNGSTAGVLAAVSAAVPKGGTILMQRASHCSAYHAVMLRELRVHYLYGEQLSMEQLPIKAVENDLQQFTDKKDNAMHRAWETVGTGVTAEEVRSALAAHPEAAAVFLTSPTYDGFSSELAAVAALVHAKGLPLIVDAAHGAHFGMAAYLPQSAVQAGADLVVMSLHKTLPAPTQTAVLHLSGKRIAAGRVQDFLKIYQTSSPSYLLMAAIDDCIARVSGWKAEVWQTFYERRRRLSERLHRLRHIRVWDAFGFGALNGAEPDTDSDCSMGGYGIGIRPEIGKLMVFPAHRGEGAELAEALRQRGLQCEMVLPAYVLLICTVMDTEEGYVRLAETLEYLDTEGEICTSGAAQVGRWQAREAYCRVVQQPFAAKADTMGAAAELPVDEIPLREAAGRISAAQISVYPPGQPIVVPGECISTAQVREILALLRNRAAVQGLI